MFEKPFPNIGSAESRIDTIVQNVRELKRLDPGLVTVVCDLKLMSLSVSQYVLKQDGCC